MAKFNKDIHIRISKEQARFAKKHIGHISNFVRDKINERMKHYEKFKDVM